MVATIHPVSLPLLSKSGPRVCLIKVGSEETETWWALTMVDLSADKGCLSASEGVERTDTNTDVLYVLACEPSSANTASYE
jgi:hypothetical protein